MQEIEQFLKWLCSKTCDKPLANAKPSKVFIQAPIESEKECTRSKSPIVKSLIEWSIRNYRWKLLKSEAKWTQELFMVSSLSLRISRPNVWARKRFKWNNSHLQNLKIRAKSARQFPKQKFATLVKLVVTCKLSSLTDSRIVKLANQISIVLWLVEIELDSWKWSIMRRK